MVQAAKIIGTRVATTGLIGAGIGIFNRIKLHFFKLFKVWVSNGCNIPKPHPIATAQLSSSSFGFITIILKGCIVLIPKSSPLLLSNFGTKIAITLPFFIGITVFASTGTIPTSSFTIEDLDRLSSDVAEANRLLGQLNDFVNRFNDFVNESPLTVAVQNDQLAVDTDSDVSVDAAVGFANRINILNDLIHNRAHTIERLLETINATESSFRNSNFPFFTYPYKYESLAAELNRILTLFRY